MSISSPGPPTHALTAGCRSQVHLPLHPGELAVHLSKLLLLLLQVPAQSQQLDTLHPTCKHESGMSGCEGRGSGGQFTGL